MDNQRLTVISSILGPQRLSIEFPDRIVPVQMRPSRVGRGEPLFSFTIDENRVVTGSINAPLGLLHRNERQIATIHHDFIPTRKRLMFRAKSVSVGSLLYESQNLPISCTLWMGLVGTDFVLRDTDGRRIAFWKRWNTRTRILISANVSSELSDAILGLVLYTEVEKDTST